jgi:hypothetical protein
MIISELFEGPQLCPECGGISFSDLILAEKKDACYHKVKASAKVWPSAYASGRLVQCRKKGAANYGNKSEGVAESIDPDQQGRLNELIDDYNLSMKERSYWEADSILDKITREFGKDIADQVDQQGVAEGGAKDRQWSNKDMERLRVATRDFDDIMASDGPEAFKQELIKKRIKTKPMVGPKGVLPEQGVAEEQELDEKWSQKYKSSINCANPKGFSQKAHCAGRNKNEDVAEGVENINKMSSLVDLPVFGGSGTSKVAITGDGRITAVVNVRGVHVPFYISTGEGGKKSVPTGMWYPFFGSGPSGYLNKGTEDSINKFYGSKVFERYASLLNRELGNLMTVQDQIPMMKKDGRAIINHDMAPMDHAEIQANPEEFKKRVNTFLAKIGDKPFYPVATVPQQTVAEGEQQKGADYRDPKEVDYDDEYDAMVARVKRLAGLGPLKTVYDPNKRVYRNMPTAVQPKK